MNRESRMDILTVVGLGAVAGMRSILPAAVVRTTLGDDFAKGLAWPMSALSSPTAMKVLSSAALGELAADKAPSIPHRTAPLPLLGRAVSGAIIGFVTAHRKHRGPLTFACVGAASAVAFTFVSHRLRQWATHRLRLPNALVGLIEDGIALSVSRSLAGRVT